MRHRIENYFLYEISSEQFGALCGAVFYVVGASLILGVTWLVAG